MYRRNYPDDPPSMSGDSYTRVSYRRNPGFFERIKNSLVGILVGSALIIIGCGLLFWNEGRAVQTAKSLDEGLSKVVILQKPKFVPSNDEKLIYTVSPLSTDLALKDEEFDIVIRAVKLKRRVEMYQWVEHTSTKEYNEGGETRTETTYSYNEEWRTDLVLSKDFDSSATHRNPTSFPVESKLYEANTVTVGDFTLSKGLVSKINNFKNIEEKFLPPQDDKKFIIRNGYYYHSDNPLRPEVGDVRIKFQYAGLSGESLSGSAEYVSVIAKQSGHFLTDYKTDAGDHLELLYTGKLLAEEIFNKEKAQNTMLTWAIRFGGWILMLVGYGCLTSILTTLVDWLPIIRDLVSAGVCVMNMTLSISTSITIIAIGWIWYRPLLGITLLAMAIAPYFVIRHRSRQNQSSYRPNY